MFLETIHFPLDGTVCVFSICSVLFDIVVICPALVWHVPVLFSRFPATLSKIVFAVTLEQPPLAKPTFESLQLAASQRVTPRLPSESLQRGPPAKLDSTPFT